MTLYLQVFLVTLADYFAYRLNFVLYRFRNLLGLVIKYYLWLAIYERTARIFGYSESQMLTYILLSSLISGFVLATRTADIAGQILNGDVINNLLKPYSFFGFQLTRDLADKVVNFVFSIMEVLLVYAFLKPQIVINANPSIYMLLGVFAFLGFIIAFNINILISFIAFWSPEVWAPRFIFFIIVTFFSGGFFPLDILPRGVYDLLLLTPFPYFYFVPTKIYLGSTNIEVLGYMISAVSWTIISSYLVRLVWRKGLREYNFYGR